MAGGGDPQLAARLEALFLDELEDQLGRLGSGLEELAAAHPEVPSETVMSLFRSAHSLKGAAQAVGSAAVAAICHDLEDELSELRDGARELDAAWLGRLWRLVDAVADERPRPLDGPEREGSGEAGMSPRDEAISANGSSHAGGSEVAQSATVHALRQVRVPSDRIDALTDEAWDLVAVGYGSQDFLDRLVQVEESLRSEEAQGRNDRETILGLLADHPARSRVGAVLELNQKRASTIAHDLTEARVRATAHQKALRARTTSFATASRRARMVPFQRATSGLHRQVRELATELDKQVELEITSSDVEVDKELILTLHETLGHLVRNALDHGLEAPAERVAAGKHPRGKIGIEASLANDGIHVHVSDDGRGVDEKRLREAAARRGAGRSAEAPLTLAEAMFAPGVSTATSVSAVSGRGVGLDAVRTAVESTGGNVTVQSEPGAGTTVSLLLPLNLATMRALLVRVGDQLMCLPSASVRRLVPLPNRGRRLGDGSVVNVGDEVIPVAALVDILGWPRGSMPPSVGPGTGLVGSTEAGQAVLGVDEVLSEREIVLRASSPRLAGVRQVLGTAQLDDGRLVLVLNPQVCLRAVVLSPSLNDVETEGDEFVGHSVLLAEDSLTTRELERSMLETAGFSVVVAQDGQQAWELLQSHDVDAVVSDVNMPRMDGIALCRAIRSSKRLASLPVVLVTSLHSEADRRAGLDAGADAYLTKAGFNRDELINALERLL